MLGKRNSVNKIATVFGRNALEKYIEDAIKTDRVLFEDKKRSHLVVGGTEQSALSRRNYDSTENIQQFIANFNYIKGITKVVKSDAPFTVMVDVNSLVSFCNTALLLISDFFSTPLAKQKES